MLTVDQLGEIRFSLFMQLMFDVDQIWQYDNYDLCNINLMENSNQLLCLDVLYRRLTPLYLLI